MKKLTIKHIIDNNFSAIDCVKYFKPEWTDEECDFYVWEYTVYPFSIDGMVAKLNKDFLPKPKPKTMKPIVTTLLLLFVCFASFGQSKQMSDYDKKMDEIEMKDYYETLKLQRRLVDLYSQYKDSCYADSTIKVFYPKDRIEYDRQGGIIGVYEKKAPYKKWIHRQPTFEGFMEFVENQYYLN